MIYYEHHRYGDAHPLTIEEWDDLDYPYLHFHGHYEFVCLYSGQLQITLDSSCFILNPGQFLLIFPNQIHALKSLGNAHARVCIFSPSLVRTFFQSTQDMIPSKIILDYENCIADFINTYLHPQTDICMIKAVLYAACAEVGSKTSFVPQQIANNTPLVHQVISYISTNFTSNISLRTAAIELGYSYNYISNQLQKNNLTFSILLNQYRLDYAKHLLEYTNKAIADISLLCGYNNLRTFNRNFVRAFNSSPSVYRHSRKAMGDNKNTHT